MTEERRTDGEFSLDELLADSKKYYEEELPSAESTPDGGEFFAPGADLSAPDGARMELPPLEREPDVPPAEAAFEPDFGTALDDFGEYEEAPQPAPVRKRIYHRSIVKKIKVPMLLKLAIYFAAVAVISVFLGRYAWSLAEDVLALNRPEMEVEVTIYSTDTLDDIAHTLKNVGAIKNERLFKEYCKKTHKENYFDPGVYTIKLSYDYSALVDHLMAGNGARETVQVMVMEGLTCEEIFALLEKNNVCNRAALEQCAASYRFDYDFLRGIPYGEYNRLEGFLFPDTYEFYLMDEPENVLARFLKNFAVRMDDELMTAVDESGYSLRQILTMASIIEGEAANDEERPKIASIMYNRMNNWDVPFLGMDSTVHYAADLLGVPFSTEIDSPYNTYRYTGLPAGPINNPGLSSIRAALAPAETDYYYFATAVDGLNRFFTNETDHANFVNSDEYIGNKPSDGE